MRHSKIQLVELTLGKVLVTPNSRYKDPATTAEAPADMGLQSAKTICKNPEFWEKQLDIDAAVRDHTYAVKLGIRTPPNSTGYPYNFEIQFTGVVVNFDSVDGDSDKLAAKYGLALLYGAIRDQLLSLTSKMKAGQLLVPTMSFEDEKYEDMFAAHQRLTSAAKIKAEPGEATDVL